MLLGAREERDLCDRIGDGLPVHNLSGRCTLDETMLIVKHASKVVCNDSMSLHLASALKVPVAVIFCSTSPDFGFGPWKVPHSILQVSNLACKPCRRHGGNVCPVGSELCRTGVPTAQVLHAVETLP